MLVHLFKCHVINQDFNIIPSHDLRRGSHAIYSDRLGAEYCFILLCCFWSCWRRSRQMNATSPAACPWSALGSPPVQNISTGTCLGCQNTSTGTHFSHLYLWSYSFNQLYLYNICYNQEFLCVCTRTQSDPRTSNNGRKRNLKQDQARRYTATTSALRTWVNNRCNNSNSDNDVWKTSDA